MEISEKSQNAPKKESPFTKDDYVTNLPITSLTYSLLK